MRLSAAVALVTLAATTMMAGVRADEQPEAEVPTGPSDVLVLGGANFTDIVKAEKLMLIEFYAPWCGHCKALAPEYEIAATQLKESNIPIAKVDCTVETELCQEHGVNGYPTLKIFRDGEVSSDFNGARKADSIVAIMKKKSLPPVTELSTDKLAEFSSSARVVIVASLPKDSPKLEILNAVAKAIDEEFLVGVVETNPDVEGEGVVLYKKFDEGKNVLEGEFTEESLLDFIKDKSVPIMDEIGPNNYANYMDSGLPLAYYFFSNDDERKQYSVELENLAKELKGKVNFVYIDASKFGAHAANLNLKDTWPAFGIQNVSNGAKYPLNQDSEFSIARAKELVEGVVSGKILPSIKSEPIPEKNDEPVKVVVADTYKDIVEDQDKDVLIEFYAPWCGHCKSLAPIYEKIGKHYEGSDIVIAKFDATTNDLPLDSPFQIHGFPTIKFRKAGSTEYTDYTGDRTEADIVKFISENSHHKVDVKIEEEKPVEADEIEHEHDEL